MSVLPPDCDVIDSTAGLSKVSGIYAIVHVGTGRVYIGSATSIKTRIGYHRSKLRDGSHDNSYLQNAWLVHGELAFKIVLVERCSAESLLERESFWMNKTRCFERASGFNLDRIAVRKMHSEETKRKISKAHMGHLVSPETRAKLSKAHKGRKPPPKTPEGRARISASLMGHKVSEETRAIWRKQRKGKIITQEHRKKISEAFRKKRESKTSNVSFLTFSS